MGITYNPLNGQFDITGGDSGIISGVTPITGMPDNAILYNDGGFVGGAGPLDDGQLLVGTTGSDPVAANITGSTSVAVTNGPGSIALAVPTDGITNTELAAGVNATKIADGSVSNAEFQFINSVTSNVQDQIDNKQPLDATLTALAAYNTNGIVTQTAADTFVGRTIAGTANQVIVTDGNGVAGNPTLALPQDIATTSTPTFNQITLNNAPTVATDAVTKNYVDTTFIPLAEKGVSLGVATLDGGGKVPLTQLPSAIMTYEGVWDASTNTPTLADGVGDAGMVYRVGVDGIQDLGSGPISFIVGDYAIYNGTTWEKSDTTDAVASVNGYTGVVVLDTDDVSEGATNLYFTTTRAQASITGAASTVVTADLTASRATISNASGKLAASVTTDVELSYVSGVTSSIQTQIDNIVSASPITGTFSGADGVGSPADVTGLLFSNASVRSFVADLQIVVLATANLYEKVNIMGIQRGSDWIISQESTGDASGVVFSITNSGQIQYISSTHTGFTSLTIKFKTSTLGV